MADNRHIDFVQRDRNWHPDPAAVGYRTTVLRHPKQALVSLQTPSASERTGPDFGAMALGAHDNDLLMNHRPGTAADGLPIGERIHVYGRVIDQFGAPVPNTLVEMWQANAGGRYRHKKDSYVAPLDPNFGGVGRTVTDPAGWYRFRTIRPGPYPWPNDPNAWRPAHIHVSVFGPSVATRLITQLYFEGDPLIPRCPIVNTIRDADAVETLTARLDMARSRAFDSLVYRFDIVTRGALQTWFENV
ncbi:protocatechuate 3,4-dioxygenase subunit beta [Salinisphaera sp. Q1T1-3]|uniref:protocatechuate 3,4-dioxygenase subunit beta n=1 Tax=Salinisphaera sp. Q1T1-3 TaxID=2321229 RepID=UPI000E76E8CB|nr:protocatechuate 3,4-dioxygenase subunit beta [Salinisphaera sp. Q1T1-3]RJS91104.1 protocatechuate 3,4-dioxygenase subunit beta [Salinisphaera sp. Q1T1-3]